MFADDNETNGLSLIKKFSSDFGMEKTAFIKTDFTNTQLLESKAAKFKALTL